MSRSTKVARRLTPARDGRDPPPRPHAPTELREKLPRATFVVPRSRHQPQARWIHRARARRRDRGGTHREAQRFLSKATVGNTPEESHAHYEGTRDRCIVDRNSRVRGRRATKDFSLPDPLG